MLHCLTLLRYKVHFQWRDTKWSIPRCHNSLSSHEMCNMILNNVHDGHSVSSQGTEKDSISGYPYTSRRYSMGSIGLGISRSQIFKHDIVPQKYMGMVSSLTPYHMERNSVSQVRPDTYYFKTCLSDLQRSCQLRHANHQQCYIAWHCSVIRCISSEEIRNEVYQGATIRCLPMKCVIGS